MLRRSRFWAPVILLVAINGLAITSRSPIRFTAFAQATEFGCPAGDNFQADRAPDHKYRTSPLRGPWAHQKGGFFHDGRFPTLLAAVQHYNAALNLNLTADQMNDLVEYLKSL
jgi:cytochrome c peroxidase